MSELTLTDMLKKQGKCLAIAISMSIVTAFVLLQPMQIWAQKPVGVNGQQDVVVSSIPPVGECKIDPSAQPMDPVDMNTVIFKPIVKTVHVEKEIFSCKTPQGLPAILDVSIYTEIIENILTPGEDLKKRFEVITCAKTFDGTILGCVPQELNPDTPLPPNLKCDIQRPLLPFPIEMNTVAGSVDVGPFVKTIQAETEVFKCDPLPSGNATKIKEVTIFTKIFETLSGMRILNKTFDSAICVKDIAKATVLACNAKKIT